MRIVSWKNLAAYGAAHAGTLPSLQHWARVVYAAEWKTLAECAGAFSKANSVGGDRVRYDIAGGDYRLIVAFNLQRGIAFVKFIGTHAEYDRIDAETVEMF